MPAEAGVRRRWPYLVGVIVLAVLAVAVAIAVSSAFESGGDDEAIGLVPEDAAAYATVYLDPSLDQKLAAKDVFDRVRGTGEGGGDSLDEAISALVGTVSSADYESDLKPQIGDQIAVYGWPGEAATLLAASDDPVASRRAMHRLLEREYFGADRIALDSYHGQPYEHVVASGGGSVTGASAFTILDGFVVLGPERGVTASIDAAAGASLADSDDFSSARSGLPGDSLAFAYVDPGAFLNGRDDAYLGRGQIAMIDALDALGPVAATLTGGDDEVALDFSAEAGSGDAVPFRNAAELLEGLPTEAIAAVSLGDLEGPLGTWLEDGSGPLLEDVREAVAGVAGLDFDRDVASWLVGLAAYVSGSDDETAEAAVVAATGSSADSDALVDRVGGYYEDQYYEDEYYDSPVYQAPDGLGFDVSIGESSLEVRGDEDRVVAGVGAGGFSSERALDADGGFGDSELYGRATDLLGGDFEPFLAVDAPAARSLYEQVTGNYSDGEGVEDWLASLETFAAGVRNDDDRLHARLVAEVR